MKKLIIILSLFAITLSAQTHISGVSGGLAKNYVTSNFEGSVEMSGSLTASNFDGNGYGLTGINGTNFLDNGIGFEDFDDPTRIWIGNKLGFPQQLGEINYLSGAFQMTNAYATGLITFNITSNSLGQYASPLFKTFWGTLNYGGLNRYVLLRDIIYTATTSSNMLSMLGYSFKASTNFNDLATNNFVVNYGTIYNHVNTVVNSNRQLALQYTTNSIPPGTYPFHAGNVGVYEGAVVAPNGHVVLVPFGRLGLQIKIAYFDPDANTNVFVEPQLPASGLQYSGGVLLRNGKIFFIPSSQTTALIYDPVTDATNVPPGRYSNIAQKHAGGVLMQDGRVFMCPYNSTNSYIYDPILNTNMIPTGLYAGSGAFTGCVLLPDGRVFMIPFNSTTARIYDPVTDTLITPAGTYPGSAAFFGGVLLPDGRVFICPSSTTSARIYDPVTDTLITPSGAYPGVNAFYGGVLLPDGRVFMVPFNATTARIYDPITDTVTTPTGTYPGNQAFIGGVLMQDGRVFLAPYYTTNAIIVGPAATYDFSIPTVLVPTYNKSF